MRDYSNMPVLNWTGANTPVKAKAQIMHEEPVILQMPDTFNASLEGERFSGRLDEETGIRFNCDGSKLFRWLAIQNKDHDLCVIADACAYSSSLVDIDGVNNRLIVHD